MENFIKIFIDQFKFTSQYNHGNDNPAAVWMISLAIIGFFAFVLIVDRIIVLFRSRVNRKHFYLPLIHSLESNNMAKALQLTEKFKNSGSVFAEIVYRGLNAHNSRVSPLYTYDFAIHEAMLEIFPKIRKRTNFISLFESVATLVGLAGTIFGLILAFDAVGGENAAESSRMLAAGISAAMGTTIGGLFIAIPTLTIGTVISYKINEEITRIEIFAMMHVKNHLISEKN